MTITASSNQNSTNRILDSNDNTNWVSSHCLPAQYFKRKDLNILLNICKSSRCLLSSGQQDLSRATDGNVYTSVHVSQGSLMITLGQPSSLSVLSVDGVFNSKTSLYGYTASGQRRLIRDFHSVDSYKVTNIIHLNFAISQVEISSGSNSFIIKEIAAIGQDGCTETVEVDLGTSRQVGMIRTRHWAGISNARKLDLSVSKDGTNYNFVRSLDPEALRAITTTLDPTDIRYIKLTYYLELSDYKHVYCYEIDAWDENGLWGPQIKVKAQTKTIREILGVNGIWGWGHNTYSSSLPAGEGPYLYDKIASHARNYHNLNWDVTDPDNDPHFSNMAAGKGTQAKSWLNWDKEYRVWRAANLTLDISVQFTNRSFPQSMWNTPEQSAYNYGREFAKHFGSVHGNGLVSSVEVGNEPWDYDASFYANVLRGMSAGIRSVDSELSVVTGTFQAEDKHATNTYIGNRVLPEVANKIDVINCHTYSFVTNSQGVRVGTYPEHKESSFNNIRPITRWRDANTPNKPVWVTEWGWDADGGGEVCRASECVTQKAQAVYGIRGLMILARSSIERATWYFYANSPDCNTLFCRSGLTTSKNNNFVKKTIFVVFEDLLSRIGDKYFHSPLQENENGYIYLFGDKPTSSHDGLVPDITKATHIVGWLPIDISNQTVSSVEIQVPGGMYPHIGWRYSGDTLGLHVLPLTKFLFSGNAFRMGLSTEPSVVKLERTGAIIG